ncbi:hypothetical protein AVEN_44752-1 [Araneus ventricosus]|uniref:Reverse transcriptase domain-containing protein n=1 Tax=Araneus ventricosus TaxID=182803 RepID=A0A4Y2HQB1_ARAVE|nr:hypothetical protein AVEN_44752-1 [Araneus ventricosus]
MVISLDIQGTFDHLQYKSIHNSLDEINFPSHTIETLKDILIDRKVTIETAQGPVSWSQQQGCAQGSCGGRVDDSSRSCSMDLSTISQTIQAIEFNSEEVSS